jgi:CRP-like cAMP-binding protein
MPFLNFQPWICEPDAPEVVELFLKKGRKRRFRRNEVFEIGRASSEIFLLKTGVIALYIEEGRWFEEPRAYSVYLAGRVLGAVRSVSARPSKLHARALRDVDALAISCAEFRASLLADDRLNLAAKDDIISKQGTQNEGLLVNLLYDPPARLVILLKAIFAAFRIEIHEGWNPVPLDLRTNEYGAIVHATRVTVSRVFGHWKHQGLLRRIGHLVEVDGALFGSDRVLGIERRPRPNGGGLSTRPDAAPE